MFLSVSSNEHSNSLGLGQAVLSLDASGRDHKQFLVLTQKRLDRVLLGRLPLVREEPAWEAGSGTGR